MKYIKGMIKAIIFQADSGYFVGAFKVKETNDEELHEKVNRNITVTGLLLEPNNQDTFVLYGEYVKNDRYGYQYAFSSYEKLMPESKDAIVEFLASNLIMGCGEKTAEQIVNVLGEKALTLIKEDKNNLLLIPNMTQPRADKIYESLLQYTHIEDTLISLKKLGFTVIEATKLIKKYDDKVLDIANNNPYQFKEMVDFLKLDKIYLDNHDAYDLTRINACLMQSLEDLSQINGDMYSYKEEIIDYLNNHFFLIVEEPILDNCLQNLVTSKQIVIENEKYFLAQAYQMEQQIAKSLYNISQLGPKQLKNFELRINALQKEINVVYNEDQKQAIYQSLKNRISIISGGPGVGKTTIVNAITKMYIEIYKLSPLEVRSKIALIAPTGRASKKLNLSTNLPAMTIHRYLKWNKETNEFQVNEHNKNHHKLIIVDEFSMVDTALFYALLLGIEEDVQLILVGDTFQLPSVGPGLVLDDLVSSKLFTYTPLKTIYRQSSNSYIPILAREIKEKQLSNYHEKKDDYNFIPCEAHQIKEMIYQICQKCIEKGMSADDIQILAPMYKGENGIDNLNRLLQEFFNPPSKEKKELKFFDNIYREGDKVIHLVNNPDYNVYNGDIGRILEINEVTSPKKTWQITLDFDGHQVSYLKDELISIKHAYAITIHKSQGSEFPNVIIPVTKSYYKMLYNKLIYTGVSRAKSSLVLIGDDNSFLMSVQNDYSKFRKTDLKNKLLNIFS